jgi:hypothetical protein
MFAPDDHPRRTDPARTTIHPSSSECRRRPGTTPPLRATRDGVPTDDVPTDDVPRAADRAADRIDRASASSYRATSPRRYAALAASVRLLTPSLPRILDTCTPAVYTLMYR